jgi:oligoendopeptidase F
MDVIISSDELNYKLNKYVFDTFPLFQDDFALEEKFLDISVSEYYKFTNFLKKDPYQMKKKLSVDSSIDIVLKFFFQLDKNYGELFKECLDKNMIYLNESKGNDENSYFQDDGEEKSINIFLYHSIVDVFSLAHEFMHFTNDLDCADSTGSYFTEVFSSYIELLLSDFLIKNYPEYKKIH